MTSPNLERLARAGELKAERFSAEEFDGLVRIAWEFLADAKRATLSLDSRFNLAYGAAHALATAALMAKGYRSGSRYLVFQCLEHTVGLAPAQCRLFSLSHERRNRAEYHGGLRVEAALVEALIHATDELVQRVVQLQRPEAGRP